jgi:hypothetical protein
MKQALVVGGQPSFIKDKLARSLKRHGIVVHTHLSWTKKRPPPNLPKGIDLVYVCTDMVGHNLAEPCVKYARELGIPFVNGTRKWAESIERLTQAGFPLLNPMVNLAAIIDEVVASRPPGTSPTKDDLRGIAIAVSGDVNKAEAYLNPTFNATAGTVDVLLGPPIRMPSALLSAALNEPAPEPAQDTTVNDSALLNDSRKNSLAIDNPKQKAYIKVLIQFPRATNKELWDSIATLHLFQGSKFDPQRATHAREQLGIRITRSEGKRKVDIDLEQFMEVAEKVGGPYSLPEAYHEEMERDEPKPVAVPAPVKVPVPVPVPAPAPDLRIDPIERLDMKALLVLLKARMEEQHFVELHITESGVTYKRIQVTEGKLEL